jgi:hypothetical protein
MLVDALSAMWSAIERKDDYFMVGSLKYPLKTNAVRSSGSASKRKSNSGSVSSFMHSMNTKGGVYPGIYLIGMASETLYSEASVFNQFSNSVFNTVAVDSNRPAEDLGVLLTVAGFGCGVLLQELYEHVVTSVTGTPRFLAPFPALAALTSTACIRRVLRRAAEFYAADKYFHIAANKGHSLTGFLLLRFEIQVFVNALWDVVLTSLGPGVGGADTHVCALRGALVSAVQGQLDRLLAEGERLSLDGAKLTEAAAAKKTISDLAEQEIQSAAEALKFVTDPVFLASCYAVWQQLCSKASCLGILNGPPAAGKTAVRRTVLAAMRAFSGLEFLPPSVVSSNSSALAGWRAALMLTRVVKRWKLRKQMFIGDDFYRDPLKAPAAAAPAGAGAGADGSPRARARTESAAAEPAASAGERQDRHSIATTVIHHSSLSCDHLIGTFDPLGRWSDGLLLRTLRNYDMDAIENNRRSVYSKYCVVVLDGPLGSQIEQLFSGSRYNICKGAPRHNEVENSHVVFPSGESCLLSGEVSILIETSDLSQASPAMLLYTPKVDVTVGSKYSSQRLVTAWQSQFVPALLQYPAWQEAAKELQALLAAYSLIADLIFFDRAEKDTSCCSAVSKTNCFLRYLEELLLQCHELFLAECVKIYPLGEGEGTGRGRPALPRSLSVRRGDMHRQSSLGGVSFSLDGGAGADGGMGGSDMDALAALQERERAAAHTGGVQFVMDPLGQELMLQRVKCAVMYAAVWAFGGAVNGSDRRGFFETVAKLKFTETFGPYAEFPATGSLFELVLDLKEGCFVNALEARRATHRVHDSLRDFVAPPAGKSGDGPAQRQRRGAGAGGAAGADPNETQHTLAAVDVEEVEGDSLSAVSRAAGEQGGEEIRDDSSADPTVLKFYTPASWALQASVDILFRSGGRVLLTGAAGSGKTGVVRGMLARYGARCPHPRRARSDMLRCLLDVVAGGRGEGGEGVPEGTPAVLAILTAFLTEIGSSSGLCGFKPADGGGAAPSSAALWYAIRSILHENDSYKASTRQHCASQTVFCSSVSLRVVPSADALRDWLARELGTENSLVLEAPRFTRGVVFIDDLHMAATHAAEEEDEEPSGGGGSRVVENRLEGLLRGILQGHGSSISPGDFAYKDRDKDKDAAAEKRAGGKKSVETKLREFLGEVGNESKLPVLHRAELSDPRLDGRGSSDYFMDDVGVVAAATGGPGDMERSAELRPLMQYFCLVSTPLVTVGEIHSALVQGCSRVLSGCPLQAAPGGATMLAGCLRDLSASSVCVMQALGGAGRGQEAGLSALEGSQRRLLFLSMPVIQRLCATLSIARQLVTSQVPLLQLWVHEWKRTYLDVFPHGVQRARVAALLQEQLDRIDCRRWRLSPSCLQAMVGDVEVATGSVWVDVDRLLRRTAADPFAEPAAGAGVGAGAGGDRAEALHAISEAEDDELFKEDSDSGDPGPAAFNRYTPVAMCSLQTDAGTPAPAPAPAPGGGSGGGSLEAGEAGVRCVPLRLHLPPSLSLPACLYPAAVAMMLRLVRALTSISAHVVLSGFVGASRLPVLHLAASLSSLGIETFEVSRCPRATEFNASTSYSALASDVRGFLKRAVLRVCGVRARDHSPSTSGPAAFRPAAPAPLLAALTSAQLLTPAERQVLLNVVAGDYAALFDNREIEGTQAYSYMPDCRSLLFHCLLL